MKLNNFFFQYRNMPHVTTGESPASLCLMCRIRTKTDLILRIVRNLVHDNHNAKNSKDKVKLIKINQKVAAKESNLHYKIQVSSNIWIRHVDQIINLRSMIYLDNDTNSEESDTGS